MRVGLVEAWCDGSHRAWAEGWVRCSRHEVVVMTHEGIHWRWRLQGGSVTMAEEITRAVAAGGPFDVLVVSATVDVASLLGLARGALGRRPRAGSGASSGGPVPVVVWFHENQLTFPTTPNQRTEVWPAWTNWRSALAGDAVVFNSEHHRREVLDAVPRLLSRSPDHGHEHRYLDLVERSRVLPVGVNSATLAAAPRPGGGEVPVIVWNHRWDHDKGPAAFVASLASLAADDVPFQVALLGDDRHFLGDARADALRRLGDRVVCSGHLDPDEYRAALLEGDLVVSTALHEFFGVSVVEAVAAGCLPVLPNRLSYPELMGPVGAGFLYDEVRPTRRLRSMLADLEPWAAHRDALRAEMVRFDWSHVGPAYDALVEDLAG